VCNLDVMADPTQLDRIEALLNTIKLQNTQQTALLGALVAGEQLMSAQLDALAAQVAQTETVEQSAITLIQGLAAQLAAVATDPAAVAALAARLNSSATALAAAITANTPTPAPPTA
jgi:hypothetical protein